jgi:adenosylcobinamide kinase / adenosylcobinamide-phosphate guanylyltransferase
MAKRLILVRHARVDAAHAGRLLGSTDVALDPTGRIQAADLAARLKRWRPQVCYRSPMLRCQQTAEIAAPELPTHIDPDLREIDFGQWEDHTFAEAAAADPLLVDRWAAFDLDFAFPGGERVGDFLQRVHAAADRLMQLDADTVLVLAHGGVVRTMLCYLLGIEPRKYVAFRVPYTALAVVDLVEGHGVLSAMESDQPVQREAGARIHLVTGGCRSGKSAYALQLAEALPRSRVYVATAPVTDDEMRLRIEAHRRARSEHGWETIEEQTDLAGALGQARDHNVVLVDCVTLWINNLLYEADRNGRTLSESEVAEICDKALDAARTCRGTVVFVTNEVGQGIVPENAVARRYRDLVGRANQTIAARADVVTLVSCGIPLHLKVSGLS